MRTAAQWLYYLNAIPLPPPAALTAAANTSASSPSPSSTEAEYDDTDEEPVGESIPTLSQETRSNSLPDINIGPNAVGIDITINSTTVGSVGSRNSVSPFLRS